MTEKYIPETDPALESFEDNRELPLHATEEQKIADIIEQGVEERPGKSLRAEDKEKIKAIKKNIIETTKKKNANIDHLINETLEKRDDGTEKWEDKRPAHEKKPWFSRITTLFSLAALLGTAQKSEGKNLGDTTLKKENSITMIKRSHGDSLRTKEAEPVFDSKKYEQFGISRVDQLKSNDPTKEILLVSIPEYKSYGEVFMTLQKAGLTPSSTETMDEALKMNEEMFRKSGAVISLKETVDKLGNQSYNTLNWDQKSRTFIGESREAQIMKGDETKEKKRKKNTPELSNFDSDYDNYRFIVEIPKTTTASYESGFAKNK